MALDFYFEPSDLLVEIWGGYLRRRGHVFLVGFLDLVGGGAIIDFWQSEVFPERHAPIIKAANFAIFF
jgi:hypothetical protein